MHVGIVIHSQSGHTANLARAIAARLRENGHEVDIELLRPKGSVNRFTRTVTFLKILDIMKVLGLEGLDGVRDH